MGTDDLFKKRKVERKDRISKEKKLRSETWLFVCEGTETEPNYFQDLLEYDNEKSSTKIRYRIEGTGKNTESLVESIDQYFKYADELTPDSNIPYRKIFAVFDKDSFKKNQFNNAIFAAQKRGYIVLWSNECIELWFLLHFLKLDSNICRKEYFKKLEELLKIPYRKNDEHFQLLNSETNLKNAVKNAKDLYEKHRELNSFADKAPCTTVFYLIDELEKYLGIKLA